MRVNFLRRLVQIAILTLFLLGNFKICDILIGDLSASLLFGKIPLSDPFAILQVFLATFSVSSLSLIGALIIAVFYAIIAPRAFCGWVCPVNLITDFANFVRIKFGFNGEKNMLNFSKNTRYFILVFVLILSAVLKFQAFENISYIGVLTRCVVFLSGSFFGIFAVIFAVDCFLQNRAICSHICPLGAFYALLGKFSLVRIFHNAKNCTKCMKCKAVCPENQVLSEISKRNFKVGSECISCGRCVEICNDNALNFSIKNLRSKDENAL